MRYKRFIEDKFLIDEPRSGKLVPFIFNKVQVKYYDELVRDYDIENKGITNPIRDIILKARREGFSSMVLALFAADDILQVNPTETNVISYKDDATETFRRRYRNYVLSYAARKLGYTIEQIQTNPGVLDVAAKQFLEVDGTDIVLKHNKAHFYCGTASARVGGRGGVLQKLLFSEAAHYPNSDKMTAKEVIDGTMRQIDINSGWVFIESTANGYGNYYQLIWSLAVKFLHRFKSRFYGWREFYTEEDFEKIRLEMTDKDMLKQEYPACVSGDSKIATDRGYILMKDLVPDGNIILNKYDKGEKQTFTLMTDMGFRVVCTEDHPILTKRGFVKLENIDTENDRVILSGSRFNNRIQKVRYKEAIVDCEIVIDRDLALFLGLFMGDGSFAGKDGTISIACDRGCDDVIREVERLMNKLFGGFGTRMTGSKSGCLEIRKSNKKFVDIFKQLNILRQNSSFAYKRDIKVPEFIKSSPKHIVRQFLRGLFEADGFADRNGNRVVFFSKYKDFIQDVQLLLLSFGITSRLRTAIKKSGVGYEYIGYDLSLRKNESTMFKEEIGFISFKKNVRLKNNTGDSRVELVDKIKSITKKEIERVYDITTDNHQFSAGGIVVHNCPEEAFIASGNTFFNKERLTYLLQSAPEPIEVNREQFSKYEKLLSYYIDKTLLIYSLPDTFGSYVAAADVAEGKGKDSSTVHLINNKTLAPCAEFDSSKIRPDEFAEFLNMLGRWYNNAYLAVESNAGLWVLTELFENLHYPNLYWREAIDDVSHTVRKQLGYHTGTGTQGRKVMLDNLLVQVNLYDNIWTKRFLTQCLVFVKNEQGRPQAMDGEHDDVVIANGICHYVRENAPAEYPKPRTVGDMTVEERIQKRLSDRKEAMSGINGVSQTNYI